jgi:hypothetical protein
MADYMRQQVNQIVRDYEVDGFGLTLDEFAQVWIRTNANAFRQHYDNQVHGAFGGYSAAEIIESLN